MHVNSNCTALYNLSCTMYHISKLSQEYERAYGSGFDNNGYTESRNQSILFLGS